MISAADYTCFHGIWLLGHAAKVAKCKARITRIDRRTSFSNSGALSNRSFACVVC